MGIFNVPADSTTVMHGSLPKLSGNAGQVLSGVGTWVAGGGGGGAAEFISGISVANYSALPDPAANSGLMAIVLASSGVWLINYKAKGLYLSDGATWLWEAEFVAAIEGLTGTIAQFNAACIDADFATGGGTATGANTGDQTSIAGISGTIAQFNTACSDADFATGGGTASGTNTGDQTLPVRATGAEINTGTDDVKFATPLAIMNSSIAFLSDIPAAVTDATIGTSDITTNDASTAKHGFLKKLSNVSTEFMNGQGAWATPSGGGGGLTEIWIRQAAARTLTSSTSEQKLFDSVTNGRLTIATGVYYFDCQMSLSGMSATSGNLAFDILGAGTAVLDDVLYHAVGQDGNVSSISTQGGSTMAQGQTGTNTISAATGTELQAHLKGTFEITTAGTIIPSVTLKDAAAATVRAGTFFNCHKIAEIDAVSAGAWD